MIKNKKRKVTVFTQVTDKKKEKYLKRQKINIIKITQIESKLDFLNILKKLNMLGYTRILVESGLIFLSFLKKHNIINNLYIFKSPNKLNKNGSNNCKSLFIKNLKGTREVKVNLFGDKLLIKSFKNV